MDRPELTFATHFSTIPDYRENHNKRHMLVEILVMAVCCTICGANAVTEIEVIANAKKAWFQTFLTLPAGIPSHDTFGRVLARIHPKAIQRCFIAWVQATFPQLDTQQIALDGKEIHHSMDPDDDFANLRMISAWAVEQGIVLGQVAVDDTSNEITALPTVLELVDVRDCDITTDALHCQTNTVRAIREAEAHYTIGVKANQKILYHDIMTTFTTLRADDQRPLPMYETIEKGHGRIETRRYWITDDLSRLSTRDVWKDLQSIGMVESERRIGAHVSHKTRYFISSRAANVRPFATRVRGHWQIENQLHWRLDVIMDEDDAHIRMNHGPENMAVLRHMAINLLKHEPSKMSIQSKRLQAACNNEYLEKVIKVSSGT
ncbi:MAG: ISAs1 family transposase [Roseiflexaceae bacterium]